MAKPAQLEIKKPSPLKRWLLQGHVAEPEGPHQAEESPHHTHPWWKVMCLTGVDYFSTLGYQPGIAALAAGALSPIATLILVLLTLFGALPIYNRVAKESPHGEGSISMLENLLTWWKGKLFVLALLGFVATDFIITITLSAADATAHVIENPLVGNALHGREVLVTLVLIGMLGAVFLKGFKEAIGIAVVLVIIYLALNAVVVARGLYEVFTHGAVLGDWKDQLFRRHGNPAMMVAAALLLFPKLALGLSGFETGVAVMPLVKGNPGESIENPEGRIRNTRKLLLNAALIMSVFLLFSSLITTLLIPAEQFRDAAPGIAKGEANGRALAYLAHHYLGDVFGTIYDVSTIAILWFAGASAMAGLLNIVPRYLPRYGMAPEWTRAVRPLVLVFIAIAFFVTVIFRADVTAQGGAYATGVLVLMTSAAIAVTISAVRRNAKAAAWGFGIIALVFLYTTIVNIVERPDGIKIAGFFIGSIVAVSLVSRIWRSIDLRVDGIELDAAAAEMIAKAAAGDDIIRIIPNRPEELDEAEYARADREAREDHQIPAEECILFLEVYISDASEFSGVLKVEGLRIGEYEVLRARGTAVPNSIAAFLLHVREITGKRPHAYLNWTEGNPVAYLFRYLLFGQGETAPITREILRRLESDKRKRPMVHTA
ncbi:MAG: amino acid transporter [Chlorobia bacterium]|nr:amino acid transporter [Fimbriimonadaceae bacterium]